MQNEKVFIILDFLMRIGYRLWYDLVQRHSRGNEREQVHDPRGHGGSDNNSDGGDV